MNILGSMIIAFSMYSKIPMPHVEWTKERMRYAFCFFPLVGAVAGAALYVVCGLMEQGGVSPIFYASVGTVLPLLITGGIHMDGFLDVTDARSSYATREKKLEILKDPHTGAFAIIGFGVYMLLYLAAFSQLDRKGLLLFCITFVFTRALSGLSVITFPKARTDGLAAAFSAQAGRKGTCAVMVLWLLLSGGCFLDAGGAMGAALLAGGGICFYWYYKMALKEFGGITGDVAGYFVQCCELVLLLLISITGGWLL